MGTPPSTVETFECPSCGNLGFGRGEIVCCDRPMERVTDADVGVTQPDLDEVMRSIFGMSETELDICLCVMEGGEQTVSELAEQVEYDRSVVSRHLNHLADLGVVDKHRRLLKEGGQVYIYAPKDPDAVRHALAGAFVTWAREALSLIDSLSREKTESMVDRETQDAQWRIYQE
ncbi:ArsR family transcriptional regulator [Natrinema altunense]|uniref:Transcriptional regulator, TrmB n=1 Tax=Natrinema altunense (strain JCM 12890 / CGMCC 1.3731 / AJ2) TaxID=1227494 RepID=L9ZZY8_NATA2|nr:ArsR family transcriptional regulator [Natrinema altunense]ELY91147.1 transcriptional regulator, TrmB [Natrinema altunense JCM 12890]